MGVEYAVGTFRFLPSGENTPITEGCYYIRLRESYVELTVCFPLSVSSMSSGLLLYTVKTLPGLASLIPNCLHITDLSLTSFPYTFFKFYS